MDSREYLKSYGWQEGEALRKGGLKKPILVKHKKDKKGLGNAPGHDEAWWERLFDGQLKSLDVSAGGSGISFKQNEVVATGISKQNSPLYRMFVRGEGLKGTLGKTEYAETKQQTVVMEDVLKTFGMDGSEKDDKKKKKAEKAEKKQKKAEKKQKKAEKKQKKEEKKQKKAEKAAKKAEKAEKKAAKKAAKSLKRSRDEEPEKPNKRK